MRTSDSVRCGWVAAKSVDIAPPSEIPSSTARSEPTAVEHRTNVVHARLQVGQTLGGDSIGEAGAALVEEDEPPHRREPPVERRELRVLPAGLEGADPAVDENEVDRPVADDLVGDPDVAASRVGDVAHGSRADGSGCSAWARRRASPCVPAARGTGPAAASAARARAATPTARSRAPRRASAGMSGSSASASACRPDR